MSKSIDLTNTNFAKNVVITHATKENCKTFILCMFDRRNSYTIAMTFRQYNEFIEYLQFIENLGYNIQQVVTQIEKIDNEILYKFISQCEINFLDNPTGKEIQDLVIKYTKEKFMINSEKDIIRKVIMEVDGDENYWVLIKTKCGGTQRVFKTPMPAVNLFFKSLPYIGKSLKNWELDEWS